MLTDEGGGEGIQKVWGGLCGCGEGRVSIAAAHRRYGEICVRVGGWQHRGGQLSQRACVCFADNLPLNQGREMSNATSTHLHPQTKALTNHPSVGRPRVRRATVASTPEHPHTRAETPHRAAVCQQAPRAPQPRQRHPQQNTTTPRLRPLLTEQSSARRPCVHCATAASKLAPPSAHRLAHPPRASDAATPIAAHRASSGSPLARCHLRRGRRAGSVRMCGECGEHGDA
eukprot:363610-Chlamydomonas_euryale.AAC.1